MLNNKGYVFVSVAVLFIVLIAVVSFSFKEKVLNEVNRGSVIEGMMDKCYYNYSKYVINLVDNFKETAYGNLSHYALVSSYNSSLGGTITTDYPLLNITVPQFDCFNGDVNMTFPSKKKDVAINYPIESLLEAVSLFKEEDVESCIKEGNCNNSNLEYLLMNCIKDKEYGKFLLRNCSIPVQQGNVIYVNLCLYNDNMTLLYPFNMGLFSFSC